MNFKEGFFVMQMIHLVHLNFRLSEHSVISIQSQRLENLNMVHSGISKDF